MFGTSGIRGPVGAVVGTLALDLGRALGSMADTVVVGRDVRESGDTLARAAVADRAHDRTTTTGDRTVGVAVGTRTARGNSNNHNSTMSSGV